MPILITLVPDSGIHFWDVDIDLGHLQQRRHTYWEQRTSDVPNSGGRFPTILRELTEDPQTRVMVDPETGHPPPEGEEVYPIGRNQAVEMCLGKWVPLPYFLVRLRGLDGRETYEQGPTNWVRGRLCEYPGVNPTRTHRLTLAFDTALVPRGSGPYAALNPQNSEGRQEFAYVGSVEKNSWFLNEDWVHEWLEQMLREFQRERRGGRPLTDDDLRRGLEHIARYIVFLEVIEQTELAPHVRLLETASASSSAVDVDLVLDIGHARTCGLLIEEHPAQGTSLNDSYPLKLRDLSRPELLHDKPFESRVEFTRVNFGRDAVARRAGRATSFAWPSPVRIGPEALRLASSREGHTGTTGLSSPKRYLWDEEPNPRGWRFNGRGSDGATDPPVSGSFMQWVKEDGTVLGGRSDQPALQPHFSRSSIFSFMLAEIIMQALCQINAPATRAERRDSETPRRLRNIVLTLPPGMPVFEQLILRERATAAVRLAWDMLGWSRQSKVRAEPKVIANLDEATATQIVWLHNEVAERLAGDAGALMELIGRERTDGEPKKSVRVASIDIGGGTTDLMIITYSLPGGEMIQPEQEFRESFKIAGDDVLERVITTIVVPAILKRLGEKGVRDPRALLSRALSQGDGNELERQARRVFVNQVLEPVALAILAAYERGERAEDSVVTTTIGQILGGSGIDLERLARPIDLAAAEAGAVDFHVADCEIVAPPGRVDAAIRAVLGRVLADLCEVIWHYDCDVLLLSGRPSRLPAVLDIILASPPVPTNRIVLMHKYRVGDRYPFRDASNRIGDPKTTAAVGAVLCLQAEGRIPNFMLRASKFVMQSTVRIVGRMDNNGQIRDQNILLAGADLDGKTRRDAFDVTFQAATLIGFRQLPIARWTATPLYMMEFRNPDTVPRLKLPFRVRVIRSEEETDPDVLQEATALQKAHAAREKFEVEEIVDAEGHAQSRRDVVLRLQTLFDQDGYWRDTGKIAVN